MKVIILAGGSGTRLWPLSRERYPKQFIKLKKGELSLFQETFERAVLLAELTDIYVVTNQSYKFLVMGAVSELGYHYDEEQIVVEPEAKNTLPAIYAGIQSLFHKEDDYVIVFPSDHKIIKNKAFVDIIKKSKALAEHAIITFGVKPDKPHTGYGYIAPGESDTNGYKVKAFKEKPTEEIATSYIKDGYLWNAGIFMFKINVFRDEVALYEPKIYAAFEETNSVVEAFERIDHKVSIDYGIMEKSKRIAVVPIDIGWNDLGSFDSIYEVFDKDEHHNIIEGNHLILDSRGNYIHAEDNKLIAAIGIEDMIVVDNRDALLICKKEESQKVKDVVDTLKRQQDNRTVFHVQDYRPWGSYKVLEEEQDKFKIKHINVGVGKRISYQMHHHRSEHWVVVRGMAEVTIDDTVSFVYEGESVFIRPGQKHRLANPGKITLEIIEVQMGDYLEEDDIIRFDDAYGRK